MREIFKILGIILVSPLWLCFLLTDAKALIIADVKRWVEALSWPQKTELIHLLALLEEAKEFRNLYYHRLFNGNFSGKLAMYLLKPIYREYPSFFLDKSCTIGAGLFIQHGFSTIIMADLGENCWINQQVTIGYKDKSGRPQLGNNVRVTAGAKIIGNLKIGNNVTVGANAVVVKDIPDNCVVVGIPARIIKRDGVKCISS
jgi:serine O-acetyltransferase